MLVDLTYLKNMSAGNVDLIKEMISIFIQQAVEFSDEMDKLFVAKEYEQLGRLAHKAKSSISIMGLDELALELKTFELKAKASEEIDKYPEFIAKFKNETSAAIAELNQMIENIELYL